MVEHTDQGPCRRIPRGGAGERVNFLKSREANKSLVTSAFSAWFKSGPFQADCVTCAGACRAWLICRRIVRRACDTLDSIVQSRRTTEEARLAYFRPPASPSARSSPDPAFAMRMSRGPMLQGPIEKERFLFCRGRFRFRPGLPGTSWTLYPRGHRPTPETSEMNLQRFALLLALFASIPTPCTATAQTPKLKVFILAGQSNMEGQAVADLDGKNYNDGKGTLKHLLNDPGQGPARQAPQERQGRVDRARRRVGPLPAREAAVAGRAADARLHASTAASTTSARSCSSAMSSAITSASQVLLIKTAWGGKSLYKDFRPPSSGGEVGPYYTKMIAEVREALANLKTDFPGLRRAAATNWRASSGIRAGTTASIRRTPCRSTSRTWSTSSRTSARI